MTKITGSELKNIRENANISLEQVAKATRIRLAILQDIEKDEYSELSSPAQIRGFLKLYAEFLDVSLEEDDWGELETKKSVARPEVEKEQNNKVSNSSMLADQKPIIKNVRNLKNKEVNNKALSQQPKIDAQGESTTSFVSSPKRDESTFMLINLGRELAARRKYLDIPWELIESQTHITKDKLLALEQGNLENFVSPLQAKGFLQTYARFLNLDTELILIRFADALQERRRQNTKPGKRPQKVARISSPFVVTLKRFFTMDLFFGTILVIGILAFLTWGIIHMADRPVKLQRNTEMPAVMDILIGSQTPIEIQTVITGESTIQSVFLPTPTPYYLPIADDSAIQLVVHARQSVWLRIVTDEEEVFRGRLASGSANAYTADNYIELEASNAAALDLVFNQTQVEPIGNMGRIIRLRFDQSGLTEIVMLSIDLPTPSPTP